MRKSAVVLIAVLALLAAACGDDDSANDAPATTGAPATTAAPTTTEAAPDTAEPDLGDLSREEVVVFTQAREEYVASCLASTDEINDEQCVLIWNCALDDIGVATAADPSQQDTLDEALDSCANALA